MFATLCAVALAACGSEHGHEVPDPYAGMTNPMDGDATAIAAGEGLYQEHCAACHGEYLLGDGPDAELYDPPPSNLYHHTNNHEDDYLIWRVAEGFGDMPDWKDELTMDEMWQIIAFLRVTAAPPGHE